MPDTSVSPRHRRTSHVGDWLDLSAIELTVDSRGHGARPAHTSVAEADAPPAGREDEHGYERERERVAARRESRRAGVRSAPPRDPARVRAERNLHAGRRRPPTRPHERDGFQPDRVAMWAVLLGVVLVLVAATSSHAADLQHAAVHHGLAVSARLAHGLAAVALR